MVCSALCPDLEAADRVFIISVLEIAPNKVEFFQTVRTYKHCKEIYHLGRINETYNCTAIFAWEYEI